MKKIHAFVCGVAGLSLMLSAGGASGAEDAPKAEQPAAAEQAAPAEQAAVAEQAVAAERADKGEAEAVPDGAKGISSEDRIDDHSIAAWLITESSQQASLGQWAKERANNDRVRSFANESVDEYRSFVTRLHEAGLIAHRRPQPDLGPVLQQLAEKIHTESDASGGRIILGFRGSAAEPGAEETSRLGSNREDLRELRQEARSERRDVAEARRDTQARRDDEGNRRSDETAEAREAREDLREERREAARETLRAALPAVRENLPWILNTMGQAIEQANAEGVDQRWIRLKQQLAQREADSVMKHLEQKEGAAFDLAFLEHQIAANAKIMDTLVLFKEHASGEFCPTLEHGMKVAEGRLQQARQLLEQIEQGDEGNDG